jgi:N-acetyltransferase 10
MYYTELIQYARYEIGSGATDWQDAERAISKATKEGGAKNITVAVKTGEKKRKVGEAVEEAFKEAEKFKEGAGGKKKKHKSSRK